MSGRHGTLGLRLGEVNLSAIALTPRFHVVYGWWAARFTDYAQIATNTEQ
jgi:hypothetical protein